MATSPVNNNPYLQQVLFQNLSSTGIQPGKLKDSAQLISSSGNAKSGIATISANGAKINNVSSTIRASGDLQAYEGFQAAISRAGAAANPMQLTRFVTSADFIARTDSSLLNDSFSALGRNIATNNGTMVDKFTSAFTSTVEQSGSEGLAIFNRGIQAIENADFSNSSVSQERSIEKYFSLVKQVNSSGESSEEIVSNLERLARGVELDSSADEIWTYFDDFSGPDPSKNG